MNLTRSSLVVSVFMSTAMIATGATLYFVLAMNPFICLLVPLILLITLGPALRTCLLENRIGTNNRLSWFFAFKHISSGLQLIIAVLSTQIITEFLPGDSFSLNAIRLFLYVALAIGVFFCVHLRFRKD